MFKRIGKTAPGGHVDALLRASNYAGVIRWACDGTIKDANERFLEMVGYTRDDLKAGILRWTDMTPREYAEKDDKALEELRATGRCFPYEKEYVRKDGSLFPILLFSVMLDDACTDGLAFAIDLTEQKQAEEALRIARDELERRVNERTAELSDTIWTLQEEVSRRIAAEQALLDRTQQLQALASQLTLTEQRERQRLAYVLHDNLQQLLVGAKYRAVSLARHREKSVREAASELSALIDQSLETSRTLTSELSPPILQAGGLIPALRWLARWMHEKHGLEVETDLHEDRLTSREDVTVLLFQSVRELLLNVVKHAGVKSALLQVRVQDHEVRVIVRDTGVGFDASSLRAGGGAEGGFGLFSIKERLEIMGGQLEIESGQGFGSRMILIAPISQASATVQPAISIKAPTADANLLHIEEFAGGLDKKIRVMLVDDHRVFRQLLMRTMEEDQEFSIVGEAATGEEAVNLARRLKPDVILMDINMPGMSGIEATHIIHSEMPHIGIIGLSMFEEEEQAAAMRSGGAIGYVTKNAPLESVMAAIRDYMRVRATA